MGGRTFPHIYKQSETFKIFLTLTNHDTVN